MQSAEEAAVQEAAEADKPAAQRIYLDVAAGQTDLAEIKKRQISAIGYVNAIENAMARAKEPPLNIRTSPAASEREIRSLYIDAERFVKAVAHYKKPKDLSRTRITINYADSSGPADEDIFLRELEALNVLNVQCEHYDSSTQKFKDDTNRSDYSVPTRYEMTFSYPSGFEYAVPIQVERGADTENPVNAKDFVIGKGGQKHKLPVYIKKTTSPHSFLGNYLIKGKPKFMQEGSFDELKILGDDGTEFDLFKEQNKLDLGQMAFEVINQPVGNLTYRLARVDTRHNILNNPVNSDPFYKISSVSDGKEFDAFFYAEYKEMELNIPNPFKIKIKKGKKLADGVWELSGAGVDPKIVVKIEGDNGLIKSNLEIEKSEDLISWGFFTDKYFDEAVPSTEPNGIQTTRLWRRIWDADGNLINEDTGVDLTLEIID